jgi:hypothetical protein
LKVLGVLAGTVAVQDFRFHAMKSFADSLYALQHWNSEAIPRQILTLLAIRSLLPPPIILAVN